MCAFFSRQWTGDGHLTVGKGFKMGYDDGITMSSTKRKRRDRIEERESTQPPSQPRGPGLSMDTLSGLSKVRGQHLNTALTSLLGTNDTRVQNTFLKVQSVFTNDQGSRMV